LQNEFYKEVWIHKDLVGYGRSPDKPLKTLWRLCGDVATRLYLQLFYRNYLETNIVSPSALRYRFGTTCDYEDKGIALLKAVQMDSLPDISDSLVKALYPQDVDRNSAEHVGIKLEVMSALQSLEDHGFLYRSIIVFLKPNDSESLTNYYELDCKINNKSKYKSELFCDEIRKLAKQLGLESSRRDNRFYGEYFAIAPNNMMIMVGMVYRLKYAVKTPRNYRVKTALTRREEFNAEVHEWIDRVRPTSKPP